MNDRQTRLLTILSAVLLVLVAVLALVKPPAESTDGDETWSPAFGEALDVNTITSIDLQGPSGTAHLYKKDGAWQVTQRSPTMADLIDPVDTLAEDRKAEDLARVLGELEIGPPLDIGEGSLDSFGLDRPIVVSVARGDAAPLVLKVGNDAPVGMRTYVQIANDPGVHVTRERIRGSFALSIDDLRDHAVARFDRSEVKRIELGTPTRLTLREDELGWWVSGLSGGELRADDARVRSFVQDVLDIRADDFPPASTWDRTPIDSLPIRLWLGDATEPALVQVDRWAADEWSVIGPAQNARVRVRLAPLPGMSLAVDPWTATSLLPVRDPQLTGVRLETPRTSFTAKRDGETWTPAAGATVVSAITAARADRSRKVERPKSSPTGRIELEEDGHRLQTLALFPALENGDVPASDRDDGPVFVVSASQIEAIESAASADTQATAEPAASP